MSMLVSRRGVFEGVFNRNSVFINIQNSDLY